MNVVRLRNLSDTLEITSHRASNAKQIGSTVLFLSDLHQSHHALQCYRRKQTLKCANDGMTPPLIHTAGAVEREVL